MQDCCHFLRNVLLWGDDDPLFPPTQTGPGENGGFAPVGLRRDDCWQGAGSIREIFRKAFEAAGRPYFNPHSLRNTLVQLGEQVCTNPEQFKAWSQNLGHERVMTTLTSYGTVAPHRQAELIRGMAVDSPAVAIDPLMVAQVVAAMQKMSGCGLV